MRLSLRTHSSPVDFLADIQGELADEVRHHLILGVAHGLTTQANQRALFLTVRDDDGLALAGLMSPKRPLILATNRTDENGAIGELTRWLLNHKYAPSGFIADRAIAEAFAKEWHASGAGTPAIKMRQRLHVLREVVTAGISPGTLRRAAIGDLDLLQRWMGAFNSEALGETLDPELRDAIARRVDRGEMFLWERDEPRSLAASARPTPRGVAINSVYTPPALRGRGYATTCVAALSRQLLEGGKEFCVLYTDLANPTSNAIYARIGYRAVSDSLLYELTGTPAES